MADIDTAAIQALIDKQAITERLMHYSRSIDRKDRALLRSVYWPEATDDHLLYNGDIDGLVEFCFDFTDDMPTQHLLGNVLIELASSTVAYAETYFQAFHNMPTDNGREDLLLGGRYIDHFEKRHGEWKILQRTIALDWYRQVPAASQWETGMFANITTRGGAKPDDPLYRLNPLAAGSRAADSMDLDPSK